nr:hypothetical protein CFP56_01150 [Quercus suber]
MEDAGGIRKGEEKGVEEEKVSKETVEALAGGESWCERKDGEMMDNHADPVGHVRPRAGEFGSRQGERLGMGCRYCGRGPWPWPWPLDAVVVASGCLSVRPAKSHGRAHDETPDCADRTRVRAGDRSQRWRCRTKSCGPGRASLPSHPPTPGSPGRSGSKASRARDLAQLQRSNGLRRLDKWQLDGTGGTGWQPVLLVSHEFLVALARLTHDGGSPWAHSSTQPMGVGERQQRLAPSPPPPRPAGKASRKAWNRPGRQRLGTGRISCSIACPAS